MARTMTVVMMTVPPPGAATALTTARLAPPLREDPKGVGRTPTGVGAVPQARRRPGVYL